MILQNICLWSHLLLFLSRNLPPEDIVAVAAGGQTSAALTDEGNLYTWGSNDEFALGRKVGMDEEHLVKKMEAPAATDKEAKTRMNPGFMRNVTQVRMGDSHSLVLTIDGKVYSTGMYKDSVSICGEVLALVSLSHFKLLTPLMVL